MWAEKSLAFYALATYHVWLDEHMAPSPTQVTAPSTPGEADGERTPEEEEGAEEEGPVGMAIGKTIVDESTVASAFREFHSFISGATGAASRGLTAEKLEKRKEVYRYYFKFLSFLLLPHGHPQRPMTEHPGPRRERGFSTTALIKKPSVSKAGTPEKLQEELKDISKIYESYLMYGLKFPKAEDYHESIGEWVDQVVENWRVSGGSAEDAAPVVEILYRASKKSFHSPRILRHLFHTLTATGNFTDAIAALDTYLCLMQNAMDRISKGHDEKDYDQDKVAFQTAVEGIRVLCKYTGNGQKAMEIASRIEDWVDRQRIKDKEILADIYRGIGIANAAFSRLTSEGELRPGSQQAAVDAFKKGLSYDPVDPQGWYGLALVEAEMRSVDDAMESARKGLGALKYTFLENADANDVAGNTRDYKRFVVPILHLLALLMTAKEDFDNAELVCKNAFDIVGEGREAVSDLGVTDKVAIFELMMTQLAIVEVVEDSETATTMAEQLLGLYGTLFDGTHLVQRQQVGNSDENNVAAGEESNPSSRPGTTASRRSRLFGRSHKKQFSASYSSLAPIQGQLDPTASTQSQGGTIRKRAKSDYQSQPALLPPPGTLQTPPKIQVTDTQSGASAPPSEKAHHRKLMRPSSLSSGTVRRMRSLGSLRLRNNEPRPDDPPTPPLPCSTEASSLNFDSPTGSLSGKDPYLFHILKNKLHTHHQVPSTNTSAAASAVSILQIERTDSPIAAESLPHNLPAHKLPYPLGAISRSLAENTHDGLARNSRRPVQLPEPKLAVDEEQKQVLGALRKAWICVSGLYRRAGFFNDAYMATQEAMGLVGADGEGEADVLAEV